MKRFFLIICFGICALAACTKDEETKFDVNASGRLQTTITEVKELLEGNSNGWAMQYFVGNSETDWGGRNYAARFSGGVAEVAFENYPDETSSSLYKITSDNGPVLSFDTYNPLMHYYGTPSSAYYQTRGGDFEFTVKDYSDTLVVLRGKRTGKMLYMRPLQESMSEYIHAIAAADSDFIVAYMNGTIGDDAVDATFDLVHRQMVFTVGESEAMQIPFIPTKTGISFYGGFEAGGATVTELGYDPSTMSFSVPGLAASLKGSLPEDYAPYDLFEGNYTFNYWNESAECSVSLVKEVPGESYRMKGLSSYYDIILTYDKTFGRLHWHSQQIGTTATGNAIWLCGWDAEKGSLSWSTDCGMETVWNMDEEHPVFSFVPNSFDGIKANSFIFWEVSSEGSVGWFKKNGFDKYNRYYFPFLNNLTKI